MIFCNCLRNSDLYLLRKGVQKSFDVLFCEKRLRLNVDVFYPLCKDDINRVGVSERNEMANLILVRAQHREVVAVFCHQITASW